jgi:hypothetical protein
MRLQRAAQLPEPVGERTRLVQHADERHPGVLDTTLPVSRLDPGELVLRRRVPPVPLRLLGTGPLHGSGAVGDLPGGGRPQQRNVRLPTVRRHQHRGRPPCLEPLGPRGVLVFQQKTQQRQVLVPAVVLRRPQHARPQDRIGSRLLPRAAIAGAHPFQCLASRAEDDVVQGPPEGRVQPVRAQVAGVEQDVVRLRATEAWAP